MAQIEFRKVTKAFDKVKVIEDLDLVIPDGKFTVLVGASGCGKTTLLRMIAGIGPATSGQVLLDGKDITDMAPATLQWFSRTTLFIPPCPSGRTSNSA